MSAAATKLTLADIADLRAYEREREGFRARIIELKKRRRVPVGPVVTVVFENRDTVRFQIQEMARAERMLTDAQIQTEIDIYNPLVPGAGELSATVFIELTSADELRTWLPQLVGVERGVELRLGPPGAGDVVRGEVEAQHDAQLTRDDVTSSVHYVHFHLTGDQIEHFAERGAVRLAIAHPAYGHSTELSEATRRSLLSDLRGGDPG